MHNTNLIPIVSTYLDCRFGKEQNRGSAVTALSYTMQVGVVTWFALTAVRSPSGDSLSISTSLVVCDVEKNEYISWQGILRIDPSLRLMLHGEQVKFFHHDKVLAAMLFWLYSDLCRMRWVRDAKCETLGDVRVRYGLFVVWLVPCGAFYFGPTTVVSQSLHVNSRVWWLSSILNSWVGLDIAVIGF